MLQTIQELFEKHRIQRVKLGAFDIDCTLRGKYISLEKFWSAAESGSAFCDVIFGWDIADVLYDNAQVTGWHTGYPDAHAVLDISTARPIPWEPGVVGILADFRDQHGGPHPACPRSLLRTVIARAEQMGYVAKCSVEYEFFLFKETPESLHRKKFQGMEPL